MLIWLLVVLFIGPTGQPTVGVSAFPTEASCKAAIQGATADALENHITDASITCTPHAIGKLS